MGADKTNGGKKEVQPALRSCACLVQNPRGRVICPADVDAARISAIDPNSRVLLYNVQIAGVNVEALLDTGATHSFLRESWALEHRIPLRTRKDTMIAYFNNESVKVQYEAYVKVRIGSRDKLCRFLVMAVVPHVMVLGIDSYRSWRMVIDPITFDLYIPSSGFPNWNDVDDFSSSVFPTWKDDYDSVDWGEANQTVLCSTFPRLNAAQSYVLQNPIEVASMECIEVLPEKYRIKGCGRKLPKIDDKYVPLNVGVWGRQMSVTASGEQEQEMLKAFLDSIPVELKQLIDTFPVLFAPPDREPPQRAVKHMVYVPLEHVPAARNAYPLSGTKLEAMRSSNGGVDFEGMGRSLGIPLGCSYFVRI